MDHPNSGLPELRVLMLKSATADLSVSQRRPLALLAGRCGPVTTEKETLAEHFESRRVIAGTTVRRKA